MGRRLELAAAPPCQRTATAACHILRTDHRAENAVSVDCVERVNRAIDHIVRNFARPSWLEAVSTAACFSAFHFFRTFKARLGETPNQFVKRQRLDAIPGSYP